jgi:hypothetical protein
VATSTTGSWPNSDSRADLGVVACGAIAQHVTDIARRRGWSIDVHPLPPLLHNHPERIAAAVEERLAALRGHYPKLAVAYADCGTYGALDAVCDRHGVARLRGGHCYDLFAGTDLMRSLFDEEPGTYVLTDFLVRTFRRTVLAELGLDRYPQLRDDYFRHYRRVVWLAQRPTGKLRLAAEDAAVQLGLPLTVIPVGDAALESALAALLTG